jgi:4-amino-4-deoxy-L-arabinose transferase-like glycosyltransferase
VGKQNKNTNQPKPRVAPASKPVNVPQTPKGFEIKRPLLWLAAIVLVVYAASFSLGYTDLDDTIFIRDLFQYNEDWSNLVTSFHRGVFDAVKDTYYRPLFLDSMILNYHLSQLDILSYHIFNVLFHMVSVGLLFTLLKKLGLKELHAFLLAMIFAVHPVLTQAVSWIPGRNDTMLAMFTLAFLIFSIDYEQDGKIRSLALSILFLLCAFFTKETAVFDAPIAFVLLVYLRKKNWLDKRNIIQYACWVGAFVVWYAVRANATIKTSNIAFGTVMKDFVERSPVVVQYLGKIFLPFNLNVLPILEDTVYYYGIAAIIILAAIIYLAKNKDIRMLIAGFMVFILFLLPVLFVPKALNKELFEHRLYLPMIGILLILPQTVLIKNNLSDKKLFAYFSVAAAILATINIFHQQDFKDPLTFWEHAAEACGNDVRRPYKRTR